MAQMPPAINVDGTETLKAMVEEANTALTQLADYLANTAVSLHPDIVRLLQSEGLDGTNKLGFGSSAGATANGFVSIARRAAMQIESGGKLVRAMHLYWIKNIKTPVDAARTARENAGRPQLKV